MRCRAPLKKKKEIIKESTGGEAPLILNIKKGRWIFNVMRILRLLPRFVFSGQPRQAGERGREAELTRGWAGRWEMEGAALPLSITRQWDGLFQRHPRAAGTAGVTASTAHNQWPFPGKFGHF